MITKLTKILQKRVCHQDGDKVQFVSICFCSDNILIPFAHSARLSWKQVHTKILESVKKLYRR